MGFSPSFQDVKGYYSANRPPLVVFVMCLLLLAFATLALAFYIQYADLVLNPEIKLTWKKILFRLDSLQLCTLIEGKSSEDEVNAMSEFIEGGGHNSTSAKSGTSITFSASLFLLREFKKFPAGMLAVSGNIQIDGLSVDGEMLRSNLSMTFAIPQNLTETSYKDTCVILTGPSWLVRLSRRNNICIPSSINKTVTHVGTVIPVGGSDAGNVCRNGSSIRLNYNNQSDNEFYLSNEEKLSIYIRLIHSSYFLFIAALAVFCYSLIRGRIYSSLVKVPLTL